MKKTFALILAVLMLTTALYGCGNDLTPSNPNSDNPVSTPGEDKNGNGNSGESGTSGNVAVTASLPGTFEIAATEPHYFIAIPDWHAESYGLGFALTEKGSTGYAIVAACGYPVDGDSLEEAFSALYTDGYNGILMQNYRAKYDATTPSTTEVTLADGSPALLFEDIQHADDYGTELNCPVYGYGFIYNGTPFIVSYIVMDEAAADDAKRAEMQGYVDEMVNTVRAAQ